MILDRDGFLHSLSYEEAMNLPEVLMLPPGTVVVSEDLFQDSEIREVILPEGVEIIGQEAFANCQNLVRVQFPSTLRDVDEGAFADCSRLEEAELPDSLVHLGARAFYGTALKRVRIPPKMRKIEKACFGRCYQLETADFPEGLLEIGEDAFGFCWKLREAVLPQSLLCLGRNCFRNCSGLERVVMGDQLLWIREGALRRCVRLQTLRIPASVETVEEGCLLGCEGLREVTVEGSPTFAKHALFARDGMSAAALLAPGLCWTFRGTVLVRNLCMGFLAAENPSEETVSAYHRLFLTEQVMYLPRETWPEVTENPCPEEDADENEGGDSGREKSPIVRWHRRLTALLRVPSMARYLVEHRLLLAGSIPDCLDEARFQGDTALEQQLLSYEPPQDPEESRLEVPEAEGTAYWVPEMNRLNSYWVEEMIFPDSLTALPEGVCADFTNLRRVHLPENLRTIPAEAFVRCDHLEEITIPDGVLYIGFNAFRGTALRNIALPDSVRAIGTAAFCGCELTSVRFPEGLLEIGEAAFQDCRKLQSVTFPGSLRRIGIGAFAGCPALEEITLPEGLRSIGNRAFEASRFRRVVLPASVRFAEPFAKQCEELVLEGGFTELSTRPEFSTRDYVVYIALSTPPGRLSDAGARVRACEGFARQIERGARVAPWIWEEYRDCLYGWRKILWSIPECLRFLLRNRLLKREEIEECLRDLAGKQADLAAAVLQYRHDVFPPDEKEMEVEMLEPLPG